MKIRLSSKLVAAIFLFSGVVSGALDTLPAFQQRGSQQPKRTSSLLINPDAQPDLPTAKAATAAASAAGLNLDDIQGDILQKSQELFYFFSIANATAFKPKLASEILPLITTTTELLDVSTQPITALNIAFSQRGLAALNVTTSLGDATLGDPGSTNWVPQFAGTSIHGVLLFASDTVDNINDAVSSLESALGDSITKVYSLAGAARPVAGTEHFGFQDGISNPAVTGFTSAPLPGQFVVPTGVILVGETGDTSASARPAWAKDGSFLVFRQLKQLVPEFNKFLADHPIVEDGLTAQQGSDLLGARMVGRWKSGAPVDLAPRFDDPALGADPTRNNNFTFSHPDAVLTTNQTRCPFAAHIRKVRPRADLGTPENTVRAIMRSGIPYGPEVSDEEAASNTTSTERGLAFVAYMSNPTNGFRFLQQAWANNPNFAHAGVGVDPIIGSLVGAERVITGLDPTNSNVTTTLTTDFIISRGGEYFFSPSLSAITSTLSV
ncbi:fungal peroxidase [Mycena olivaceomarginata]|nr:fungal peroxidase [Mycena olivaceomarginata]